MSEWSYDGEVFFSQAPCLKNLKFGDFLDALQGDLEEPELTETCYFKHSDEPQTSGSGVGAGNADREEPMVKPEPGSQAQQIKEEGNDTEMDTNTSIEGMREEETVPDTLNDKFETLCGKFGEPLAQPFRTQCHESLEHQRTTEVILGELLLVAERALDKGLRDKGFLLQVPRPYVMKWLLFWTMFGGSDLSLKALNVLHSAMTMEVRSWDAFDCNYQHQSVDQTNTSGTEERSLEPNTLWKPVNLNSGSSLQPSRHVAMIDNMLLRRACMESKRTGRKSLWIPDLSCWKWILSALGGNTGCLFESPFVSIQRSSGALHPEYLQKCISVVCHTIVNNFLVNPLAYTTAAIQSLWIMLARVSLDTSLSSCYSLRTILQTTLGLLCHVMERRCQLRRVVEDENWCDMKPNKKGLQRSPQPRFEEAVTVVELSWEDGICQALCDIFMEGRSSKTADSQGDTLPIPSNILGRLVPSIRRSNHPLLMSDTTINLTAMKRELVEGDEEEDDTYDSFSEVRKALDPNVRVFVYATANPKEGEHTIEKYGHFLSHQRKSYAVDEIVDIWDDQDSSFRMARITHFYSQHSKIPRERDGKTEYITTDEPLHEVIYLGSNTPDYVDFARSVARPAVVPRSVFGDAELPSATLDYLQEHTSKLDATTAEEVRQFKKLDVDSVIQRIKGSGVPLTKKGSYHMQPFMDSPEELLYAPSSISLLVQLLDKFPVGPLSLSASSKFRRKLSACAAVFLQDRGENTLRRRARQEYLTMEAKVLDTLQEVLMSRGDCERNGERRKQQTVHAFIEKERSVRQVVEKKCGNTVLGGDQYEKFLKKFKPFKLASTFDYVEWLYDQDALESVFSLALTHSDDVGCRQSRVHHLSAGVAGDASMIFKLMTLTPIASPKLDVMSKRVDVLFFNRLVWLLRLLDHALNELFTYKEDDHSSVEQALSIVSNPSEELTDSTKDTLKSSSLTTLWNCLANIDGEFSPESLSQLHRTLQALKTGEGIVDGHVVGEGTGFSPMVSFRAVLALELHS
eukprot:gb/GECG01009311.1/.p1 GENE.gb/GECG01009311.1/~~gb/GECG01009311.1/.p1  ORF type:complete len:1025 (+),score=126.95 gb/GECG01009311.1/:1-3075(+)